MREFTPEEKEMIVNTPITGKVFDFEGFEEVRVCTNELNFHFPENTFLWKALIGMLDDLRHAYLGTKDERYFTELVRLLPNSYKVVKL